jgi:hypothetical protein
MTNIVLMRQRRGIRLLANAKSYNYVTFLSFVTLPVGSTTNIFPSAS